MPNKFWPNTTSALATGNQIQQTTAANNPDIFCESQGSGYRLPSVGEFTTNARSINPWGTSAPVTPRHWSAYTDNDIQKPALPNVQGRLVSGGIINEWGDLSAYQNGWSVNYWTTEPSIVSNTYQTVNYDGYQTVGKARYSVNAQNGVFGPLVNRVNIKKGTPAGAGTPDFGNTIYNVACVRDLVPTPATPNPSKS